jgi:glutamate racemase
LSDNRAIGVFDSGVGGLTVLRALHSLLPNESTVYVGDLARCPYGTRAKHEVQSFALQIGDYLADHHDIKLLVVACNTATAAAYELLCDRYPFPVLGVVEPGARTAASSTRSRRIGVVATNATVASGAYRDAIRRLLPEAVVIERPASWLVPLIERGPVSRPIVAAKLQPLMDEMHADEIDILILGCTHFPLVRDIFEDEVGPCVTVVDSAETTAAEVARLLDDYDLPSAGPAIHRWLVTGPAEAFAERAQIMFRTSPAIESLDLVVDHVF